MLAPPRHSRASFIRRAWGSSVVRYLVAGGFAFGFDVGLLWILHEAFSVPLVMATPVAFLASFVVTYTLQRTVAFRSEGSVAPSVVRYALLVAVNTLATTGIVALVDWLNGPWVIGKVLAVVVTTIGNYFAYRYWVFARKEQSIPHV